MKEIFNLIDRQEYQADPAGAYRHATAFMYESLGLLKDAVNVLWLDLADYQTGGN